MRKAAEKGVLRMAALRKVFSSSKFLPFLAWGGFGRTTPETTVSWPLDARKLWPNPNFARGPSNSFVITCTETECCTWSEQPFRHFVVVGRPTVAKCDFARGLSNPFFITLDIQNCGKTSISNLAEQPFRHFVVVGCPKLC